METHWAQSALQLALNAPSSAAGAAGAGAGVGVQPQVYLLIQLNHRSNSQEKVLLGKHLANNLNYAQPLSSKQRAASNRQWGRLPSARQYINCHGVGQVEEECWRLGKACLRLLFLLQTICQIRAAANCRLNLDLFVAGLEKMHMHNSHLSSPTWHSFSLTFCLSLSCALPSANAIWCVCLWFPNWICHTQFTHSNWTTFHIINWIEFELWALYENIYIFLWLTLAGYVCKCHQLGHWCAKTMAIWFGNMIQTNDRLSDSQAIGRFDRFDADK